MKDLSRNNILQSLPLLISHDILKLFIDSFKCIFDISLSADIGCVKICAQDHQYLMEEKKDT